MAIIVDGWRIVSQYRKCGKDTCSTCMNGKGHGPYYYGSKVIKGKRERKYFGTKLPHSRQSTEIQPQSNNQGQIQKSSTPLVHSKKLTKKSQKKTVIINEEDIYQKIREAILFQKLRPNMQMKEEVLADVFGVSRTPIRNVLRRLTHEKIVKNIPNKGTFVYCPTIEEAKEICEARKEIETVVIRKACQKLTEEQFEELELFIKEEHVTHDQEDFFERLRLTCDFHVRIAEMIENPYFYRYLDELISLVYVVFSFYGPRKVVCNCKEHLGLLFALKQRDEHLAEQLLIEHLDQIESSFDFDNAHITEGEVSLETIFNDI